MPHARFLNRREFLTRSSVVAVAPWLSRCTPPEPPRRFSVVATHGFATEIVRQPDGSYLRTFSGRAAPENLEVPGQGALYERFPNAHCPFSIDTSLELGEGGYALATPDRTLARIVPAAAAPLWPLNMIPFGVAVDGALFDPSGPWYDGGPADPNNPFDRACSGWEYDPIYPTVAALVGVPEEVRGHVQPGAGGRRGSPGQFHYHGLPRLMLERLRAARLGAERDQVLVVGYSADGFWILEPTVPAAASASSKRLHLFSGYVRRDGARTAVAHTNPGLVPLGDHDGTFVQDFRYDPERKRAQIEAALRERGSYHDLRAEDVRAGLAEAVLLDERGGLVLEAFSVPGAPAGAYVYALTPDWPEVPRAFALEPAAAFRENVIPFEEPHGQGPPGRQQLYAACGAELGEVHQWYGREPY